jgi:2-amino-4-hydroxy-6-hydroxymethyldihydropteridine diphosphokinase
MPEVFVGVGSNSEPERQLRLAVQAVAARFGALRLSAVYASAPVGFAGPDFLNLVLGFGTDESPQAVAAALEEIERGQNGQPGSGGSHGRAIDLDFLLYEDRVIDTPELTLPREDVRRYAFVLRPLAELAPALRHPLTGMRLADMWAEFPAHAQPLRNVELELS